LSLRTGAKRKAYQDEHVVDTCRRRRALIL